MDVSRSNYSEVLPEILEKLETADFISFDAEYTGLKSENGAMTSLFDSPAQRYEILRQIVFSNSAPQFGISIFHRMDDPTTTHQMYSVDAYCFYLMEPSFGDFNMNKTVASVEIDCTQFLGSIKFDYEKWFLESTPYLNNEMVEKLEQYLEKNPDFMQKCRERGFPLDPKFFPEFKPKLTPEDQREIVNKLRGFSVIVDVISRRGLPVVGHNMALDLMYFFNNFCQELPEKYNDFKSQVTKFLPRIFDTKFMTVKCRKMLDHPALLHSKDDIAQLQCSGLYIIYKTSTSVKDKFAPKFKLMKTCQYFKDDLEAGKIRDLEGKDAKKGTLCHQPSFDACITGIVFLHLGHIACRISKEFLQREFAPSMEEIFFHVNHWRDQVFVSRATVMTMCLRGDDPRPNRTWLKVTFQGEENLFGGKMFHLLRSDPDLKNMLEGVDHRPVGRNQIMLAIARLQSAKDLSTRLTLKGFYVERILIPWDKKRFHHVTGCTKDEIYDSGRNTFFY